MKNWKRITAAMTAALLCCTSLAGCSSAKKKTEDDTTAASYAAEVLATIDSTLEEVEIVDDVLYATTYLYDEVTETDSYSLLSYDLLSGTENKAAITLNTETPFDTDAAFFMTDYYVNSFSVDSSGQITVDVVRYLYTFASEEDMDNWNEETFSEQTVTLLYDSALTLISETDGDVTTGDNYTESNEYAYSTLTLSDGRQAVYGCINSEDSWSEFLKVLDTDGTELGRIDLSDISAGELLLLSDESLLLSVYGDSAMELYQPDLDTFTLGDPICEADWDANGFYAGPDKTLLCTLNGYYTSIDLASGETTKLFQFIDCDINPDDVGTLFCLSDGTLGAVYVNYDSECTDIYTFTEQDPSTVKAKTEIHIATGYTDSLLQEQVIAFNKANDTYKIVIDAYLDDVDWESDDGYTEALDQLNAAIVSGDGPDLIDLSSLNAAQLAEKGVFEDLMPYLESDDTLTTDALVSSALNAAKTGDALYYLPVSFGITALAGAASELGTDPGWTMSEFVAYAQSLPDGCEVIEDLTSDGLLSLMLYYNMDNYIDWETGECRFDTDEFISLLDFCGNYQSSDEYYENYDWEADEQASIITKIRNKQIALYQLYLYDIDEYLLVKQIYGEDITVKGYPVSEGNGILLSFGSPELAINAKSAYKDVAWEFIKTFFTEDVQTSWNITGFPMAAQYLEAALTETMEDEYGDGVYTTWSFEDIELEIPYPTQADIDEFLAVIDNADTVSNYDENIYSLVSEEAEAFFSGQKSAAEVAEVIQSRVSIYVKENQ